MIISKKIIEIAQKYIDSNNENLYEIDGICYKYGFKASKEFCDAYYFDFIILKSNSSAGKIPEMAGAPGFLINKLTFEVEVISFGMLTELYIKEHRIEKIVDLFSEIRNKKTTIFDLKRNINSNTVELLRIKNRIEADEISQEFLNEFYNMLDNHSKEFFDSSN